MDYGTKQTSRSIWRLADGFIRFSALLAGVSSPSCHYLVAHPVSANSPKAGAHLFLAAHGEDSSVLDQDVGLDRRLAQHPSV